MGKVQQQFFPDSSRPEVMVEIWSPEGTSFEANEEVAKRVEKRFLEEEGVKSVSTWVGSGVPRFYLPLDQVFPQTNVSQFIVLAKDLHQRESLRVLFPELLAAGIPRGTRPRQAAAQRPAGAVPGAIPSDRHRPSPVAHLRRRGQGGPARELQHARRQRQLERVGQGDPARSRPGQGARARRDQPGDRAGFADHVQRHHRRPVPRERQAHRHRAAPVARGARAKSRTSATPTCPRPRASRFR